MFDQLIVAADDLRERLLRTKGYDSVAVQYNLKAKGDGQYEYGCWLELRDNFQPVYGNDKVDVGDYYIFESSLSSMHEEVAATLAKLRGREQREFTFLMKGLTASVEHRDMLTTAAGRDFAAALLEERNKFIHLLTADQS